MRKATNKNVNPSTIKGFQAKVAFGFRLGPQSTEQETVNCVYSRNESVLNANYKSRLKVF